MITRPIISGEDFDGIGAVDDGVVADGGIIVEDEGIV
jgi:hypothetical protein